MTVPNRISRAVAAFVVGSVLLAACSSGVGGGANGDAGTVTTTTALDEGQVDRSEFPPAPQPIPAGALADSTLEQLDALVDGAVTFGLDRPAVLALVDANADRSDPRVAWLLTDLMRVIQGPDDTDYLADAFEDLTGVRPEGTPLFRDAQNLLIAWDVPAFPGYVDHKGRIFAAIEPAWQVFFDDADATVDWRFVTWGGVRADDRSLGEARRGDRCQGCIPALIDPPSTSADAGDWLGDDALVFGIVVDGNARAYPVHQLEAHELVQDDLGGRRLALVFCTLCRSAQAFLVDDVPDDLAAARPRLARVGFDLRTSGLLQRSNKLAYEAASGSLIEAFTGEALTGPLREAGVVLPQVAVVTSTWGAWRDEYPDTTLLAEDGGIGRDYGLDPLGGRDDAGPIFAIGDVDPRLAPQDQVVGVLVDDGTALAFPVVAATAELGAGRDVAASAGGQRFEVVRAGDGLAVRDADGAVVSHQAFWFAWSQFHVDSELWLP